METMESIQDEESSYNMCIMRMEQRTHAEDVHNNEGDEYDAQNEVRPSTIDPNTDTSPGLRQILYKHRGVLCILLSAFSFALENVLFRAVENDMHVTEVLFSTYLLKICYLVPVLTYNGHSLKPGSKLALTLLIGRGFLGTIGFNSMYFSLRHINVGDATAIVMSSPVFVGIFARIFLKEAYGIIDGLLTLVVVVGVFLISKPSFIFGGNEAEYTSNLIGAGLALFACICFSVSCILNRQIGLLQINNFINVIYYTMVGFLGSGILTSVFGVWSLPPCGYPRAVLVIMSIVGCAGTCFREYSYSIEKSLLLVIFSTNEIIFAYLLEFLLFNVTPDLIALLGVCVVVSASVTTLIKKRKEN